MQQLKNSVTQASRFLLTKIDRPIDTAIVLGSGLSSLSIPDTQLLYQEQYKNIAGLIASTAPSHAGELRILKTNADVQGQEKVIAICAGRHHLYEGYSAQEVCLLTYVLSQLGCKNLMITNAAGALNSDYQPGDIMLIEDHINMTGQNPLIGQDDTYGMRFPDMSQAYNKTLLEQAHQIAHELKLNHHIGIYAGVSGPSLETSAERRMLRAMGSDAVGMSTVMEVIAANHCSMNVLGLSAITNLALGDKDQQPDTIEEVLENALIAGRGIQKIIEQMCHHTAWCIYQLQSLPSKKPVLDPRSSIIGSSRSKLKTR